MKTEKTLSPTYLDPSFLHERILNVLKKVIRVYLLFRKNSNSLEYFFTFLKNNINPENYLMTIHVENAIQKKKKEFGAVYIFFEIIKIMLF